MLAIPETLEDDSNEVWSEEEHEALEEVENLQKAPPSIGEELEKDETQVHALSIWLMLFLAHLQATFHLPDGVIKACIMFFKAFFTVLGRYSELCAEIATNFPSTLHRLETTLGLKDKLSTRYVV